MTSTRFHAETVVGGRLEKISKSHLPSSQEVLDYARKMLRSMPAIRPTEIARATNTSVAAVNRALSEAKGLRRLDDGSWEVIIP